MMALESNFEQPLDDTQAAYFKAFVAQTEGMLKALIVQLRESKKGKASDHFDLRATHSRLVESTQGGSAELTLLIVETDRLTNSLNTLQEQISTWMLLNLSRRSIADLQ